ncbi:MAG: NAD-dependent epimerase [Clostridiales bacterium GWF2_36_10]|nr:MAG: NAD-dependent epimerase [Clostridiales bacterium GWF2_36_10]HAN21285.1 NAD-dependent epimerase [Clostridiales bacterium]
MKKILITGADSYIGTSFEKWLSQWPDEYKVETVDMIDGSWREKDFSGYDSVFHVAGIAHVKETKDNAEMYYKINRDLAIETAEKARDAGVAQFIFLSSMAVYNGVKEENITNDTILKASNHYGKSKAEADMKIQSINNNTFRTAVLRPPMIFGPNCKGNFPRLMKLGKILPLFPDFKNQRSMLYIDNLSEFVKLIIDNIETGVFFPQNEEFFSSTEIIKAIAKKHKKKIWFTKRFNWAIYLLRPVSSSLNKAFGNLTYDKSLSNVLDKKYIVFDNPQSLEKSIYIL